MPPAGGPAPKRPRRDWAEDTYDPQPRVDNTQAPQAPVLMTFKQFLATQDDSISDDEAIGKYQDYKLEFKRQQLHAFFMEHKDEEWFKVKYHPEDSVKAREEAHARVHKRFELFGELEPLVEMARLDHNNEHNIVRLLDALVVRLEDGTMEDVEKLGPGLELPPPPLPGTKRPKAPPPKPKPKPPPPKKAPKPKKDVAEMEDGEEEEEEGEEVEEEEEAKKEEPSDDGEVADANGNGHAQTPATETEEKAEVVETQEPVKKRVQPPPAPETQLHKTASIFLRNISPAITKAEVEQLCQRYNGFLRVGLAEPLSDRSFYRRGWISFQRDVNIKDIAWNMGTVRLHDCDLGPIVNRDLTRRVRTVNGLTAHRAVAQNDLRHAAKLVQVYDAKWGLYQETKEEPAPEEAKPEGEEKTEGEGEVEDPTPPKPPVVEVARGGPAESRNPLLSRLSEFLIEEASAEEEELLGEDATSAAAASTPFERDEELIKVLDRIILYLRLVHSVDFYNQGEYPHEDEMPNRCGLVHVRGPPPSDGLVPPSFAPDFGKTVENKLQPLLQAEAKVPDDELAKLGKKDPEKEVEAFITANTQELAKDKWLCPLSGKKFKGPEFIRKHLQNKHGEKLDEVRLEVAYFNNYLADPKRVGATDPPKAPLSASASSERGPSDSSSAPPPSAPPARYGGFHDTGGGRPPSLVNTDFRGPPGFGGAAGGGGGGGFGGYAPRGRYGSSYGGGGGGGYGGGPPPRRDYGGPPPRSYGGPPFGRPSFEGRRDPREPITYKDLDAPEDNY